MLQYTYDARNYDEILAGGLIDRLIEGKLMDSRSFYELRRWPPGDGQYDFMVRNMYMALYLANQRPSDGRKPIKVEIDVYMIQKFGAEAALQESLKVLAACGFAGTAIDIKQMGALTGKNRSNWEIVSFSFSRVLGLNY